MSKAEASDSASAQIKSICDRVLCDKLPLRSAMVQLRLHYEHQVATDVPSISGSGHLRYPPLKSLRSHQNSRLTKGSTDEIEQPLQTAG
eukprot:m.36049 g.36049  ORF g.36049 m.36049 type:complete len:89 (+) comp12442_c0_seq2:1080-1346(+)